MDVPALPFVLEFRGHATALSPGVLLVRATAPADGVLDATEAHLEARVTLLDDGAFEEAGTVSFGNGSVLRFHTAAPGTIGPSPEPSIRHGAASLEIDRGAGACLGATGRIASTFLVSDTGDLTDRQVGVLFLAPEAAARR